MKVVLTKNVEKLGTMGSVICVSDGYAQNYLIPKMLAKRATMEVMKEIEAKKASDARNLEIKRQEAVEILKNINGKTILINQEIGKSGKIYGSITAKDVSEAIENQLKVQVEKKKILLPENINEFGPHECKIKFFPDIIGNIVVEVSEKA